MIACCVDRVAGRVPVIAGTGANDTRVACGNALAAERLGADGLLIVTPYYNKATQQGLLRHYKAIADSVTTPIILYNVPSRTGVNILPETYAELARHPNVVGVRKPAEISARYRRPETSALLILLSGPAMMTRRPPSVCWAAPGSFLWAANVLPAQMHELTSLCLANDFHAAGRLQLKLKPLCDALFCEVNPIPVKTALNLMGLEAGELRLPLCPPADASVEKLKLALSAWDLLPNP